MTVGNKSANNDIDNDNNSGHHNCRVFSMESMEINLETLLSVNHHKNRVGDNANKIFANGSLMNPN